MRNKIKKQKLNLNLPPETVMKAKTMAAAMNISVSHLVEGLIAGFQIMPPEEKN